MRSRSTFVTVARTMAVRSRALRGLSLAAQRVMIQVWAVACDEGEATWADDRPADVIVAAGMVDADALTGELGRHAATTEEAVEAALEEIRGQPDLWADAGDGLIRLPRLAEKMPKRFRDRARRQGAKSKLNGQSASATSRDVARHPACEREDRTGERPTVSPGLSTPSDSTSPPAAAASAPAREGPAAAHRREGPQEAPGSTASSGHTDTPTPPPASRTRPPAPPPDRWGPCPACAAERGQWVTATVHHEKCPEHGSLRRHVVRVACPCGHDREAVQVEKPCMLCSLETQETA